VRREPIEAKLESPFVCVAEPTSLDASFKSISVRGEPELAQEALGTTKLNTSTAWTAGEAKFEGVLARDLLQAVGAQGTEVVATALNDYVATIPFANSTTTPFSWP
jgi:hypothetical protein